MNRYPVWIYVTVAVAVVLGALYTLPNFFGEAPAVQVSAARATLKPDGAVWVSWPKKASKVSTDITEDTIRELCLPIGFVDIKVCAVSDIWSGLKLVIRKELR